MGTTTTTTTTTKHHAYQDVVHRVKEKTKHSWEENKKKEER